MEMPDDFWTAAIEAIKDDKEFSQTPEPWTPDLKP